MHHFFPLLAPPTAAPGAVVLPPAGPSCRAGIPAAGPPGRPSAGPPGIPLSGRGGYMIQNNVTCALFDS